MVGCCPFLLSSNQNIRVLIGNLDQLPSLHRLSRDWCLLPSLLLDVFLSLSCLACLANLTISCRRLAPVREL